MKDFEKDLIYYPNPDPVKEPRFILKSVDELEKSTKYSVTCNGTERVVYHTDSFDYVVVVDNEAYDLEISIHTPFKELAIRPTSFGIEPSVKGETVHIHLDEPRKFTVETDGGLHDALFVFCSRRIEKPEMVAEVYAPEYVEYMAANGDIKEVLLADGTRVYLNAQSRLNCEKSLTGATRDVFLCGEAFFEVAKDTLHPFIVHAAGTQIKVTGTKFNVRAFPDEDSSTTTLVEGGVEVRIPGQVNPITLVPGTALSVSNKNLSASLFEVDAVNATGWYRGEFNAYHMTLEQICHNLERRFGVKIFIANQNVASKLFYASFVNNEDVEGILKSLNVNKDFHVKKHENLYTIY